MADRSLVRQPTYRDPAAHTRRQSLPHQLPARHRQHFDRLSDHLLRKPGGFRNYRHRNDLFPQEVFRQAWEALNQRLSPRQADITYLRILKQAAAGLETDVAQALGLLLADQEQNLWDEKTVLELTQATAIPVTIPPLSVEPVNLSLYDQLLPSEASHVLA